MSEPSSIASKAASATTYIGSSGAVVFGLSANEMMAFVGAAVAVLGLIVNIWFKHQHLKLARAAVRSGKAQIIIEDSRDD